MRSMDSGMKEIPRISEAEWEILSVLWKKAPLTAAEVFAAVRGKAWKLNTVRTQDRKEEARVYLPVASREACVRRESESFLARVFEGGAAALLLHFTKSTRLSAGDLAELEAILARKRKEKKS